jgi:hypothetical protein
MEKQIQSRKKESIDRRDRQRKITEIAGENAKNGAT